VSKGPEEILTVNRLRLPTVLRRSPTRTNAIENIQGTIRRVTRYLRAAGMLEAKGFRLKAHESPELSRCFRSACRQARRQTDA
jgi:putative transposase